MALRPENLPSDPALLAELALGLDAENESLRAMIANLKGLIFGARSERLSVILAEQLPLDLEDAASIAPPPANDDAASTNERARRPRAKSKRNIGALPANLPRHVSLIMDGTGRWAESRHRPPPAGFYFAIIPLARA